MDKLKQSNLTKQNEKSYYYYTLLKKWEKSEYFWKILSMFGMSYYDNYPAKTAQDICNRFLTIEKCTGKLSPSEPTVYKILRELRRNKLIRNISYGKVKRYVLTEEGNGLYGEYLNKPHLKN